MQGWEGEEERCEGENPVGDQVGEEGRRRGGGGGERGEERNRSEGTYICDFCSKQSWNN